MSYEQPRNPPSGDVIERTFRLRRVMSIAIDSYADPASAFGFLRSMPQYGSAAKAENYARLIEAKEAGALVVDAAPAYIRLEPNASCNLRCCWAQRNPKHPALRPRGNATPDLARRIVEQIGDRLYQVILCHWGEPTLNKQLPDIVRVFHDADIYTTFDTNMTLMTVPLAEALIEAGLDRISGSIDGVAQESYEQYRILGNVDRALGGLKHLVDARRRLGRFNPIIRWQFLVFPHNEHEVDRAQQLAREIGVDEFDVFGAGGRAWSRETGFMPPSKPERPAGVLCDDPWTYLAVDWDGAVHLCCRAFQAKHVAGHMSEQTLTEIFDNDRFRAARRVICDGAWDAADGPTPCTGCTKVTRFEPHVAKLGHVLSLEDDKDEC